MHRPLPRDGVRSTPLVFPDERSNLTVGGSSVNPPDALSHSNYSPRRYFCAPELIHPQLDPLSFHLESLSLTGDSVLGHRAAVSARFVDHGLGSDDPWHRQDSPICPHLKYLRGKILRLATDRNWSRILQKKMMDFIDEEEIGILFLETIEYFQLLMVDKTSSFFLQSLLDVLDEQQVTQIIRRITATGSHFIGVCLNSYGSRVVQKLLRQITTAEQKSMVVSAIVSDVVSLMNDSTGHRVIEICIETFSPDEIAVIYRELIPNCYYIATDKCGCRIIQKLINSAEGIYRDIMVNVLVQTSLGLAIDSYGNYVVQFLLGMGTPQVTRNLIMRLQGNFAILSCDKYGSNVVETCLRESTDEEFEDIVVELVRNCSRLVLLDQFGNYVIQSAVRISKERRLWLASAQLEGYISRYRHQMNCHFYGKKLLTRLEKR